MRNLVKQANFAVASSSSKWNFTLGYDRSEPVAFI